MKYVALLFICLSCQPKEPKVGDCIRYTPVMSEVEFFYFKIVEVKDQQYIVKFILINETGKRKVGRYPLVFGKQLTRQRAEVIDCKDVK